MQNRPNLHITVGVGADVNTGSKEPPATQQFNCQEHNMENVCLQNKSCTFRNTLV